MKPRLLLAAFLFVFSALPAWTGAALAQTRPAAAVDTPAPQLDLPRITLRAGMHTLDVQVARTPREREIGLMYRRQMPEFEGMLFVFEQAGVQCFWMKNTLIPLTAAFVADDGRIVNLADMAPQSTDSHCSRAPVRYVLETNQGWFATRHIGAGQKLQGRLFEPP